MEQQATPVVTLTAKQRELNAEVKGKFEAIKAKFGTVALKSSDVYTELSPRHLDLLRAYGVKLAFGYYSLEHYFGEKAEGEAATPVSEARPGVKVWKDRAKKGAAQAEVTLTTFAPVNVFAKAEELPPVAVETPKAEPVAGKPVKANKKAGKVKNIPVDQA